MREISSEHNTTTFLPVPIDLFSPFIKRLAAGSVGDATVSDCARD